MERRKYTPLDLQSNDSFDDEFNVEDEDDALVVVPVSGGIGMIRTANRLPRRFWLAALVFVPVAFFVVLPRLQNHLDEANTTKENYSEEEQGSSPLALAETVPPTRSPTTWAPTNQPTATKTTSPPPTKTSLAPTQSPQQQEEAEHQFRHIDENVKYYTVARTDRSGASIKEMLLAHAHSFWNNVTYGGACIDAIDWSKKRGDVKKLQKKFDQRLVDKKKLINTIGLADDLLFACPTKEDLKNHKAYYRKRSQFTKQLFPAEWIEYLRYRSNFVYDEKPASPSRVKQVAIHLRRGDFTPCHVADRYMPNIYYLQVMDMYLPRFCPTPESCHVTVYSEPNPYEPFDPFLARNVTLDLDSSVEDIWKTFINADVLIMSRSSFSFVPALLNRNFVVAPYTGIAPWTMVDWGIYNRMSQVLHEQTQKCP